MTRLVAAEQQQLVRSTRVLPWGNLLNTKRSAWRNILMLDLERIRATLLHRDELYQEQKPAAKKGCMTKAGIPIVRFTEKESDVSGRQDSQALLAESVSLERAARSWQRMLLRSKWNGQPSESACAAISRPRLLHSGS